MRCKGTHDYWDWWESLEPFEDTVCTDTGGLAVSIEPFEELPTVCTDTGGLAVSIEPFEELPKVSIGPLLKRHVQ